MKKYPVHPEKMQQRMERIVSYRQFKISHIFAIECKLTLYAYYGSQPRAAMSILLDWIYEQTHYRYWRIMLAITDKCGWTKLRSIPGTQYFERHGGKCDHYNCQDMDCIGKSLPPWFRKITRWDKP